LKKIEISCENEIIFFLKKIEISYENGVPKLALSRRNGVMII
jgi:hypothetical protein